MSPARPTRGFTLSPLVILLALALIGLISWKLGVNLHYISGKGFFASEARSQVWTRNIFSIFVFLAISGGVGAFAYLAFKKSETAANIGMAVPLLVGVFLYAWQGYNYLAGNTPVPALWSSSNGIPTPPPMTAPSPAPLPRIVPPRTTLNGPSVPPPTAAPTGAPPRLPTLTPDTQKVVDTLIAEINTDCTSLADSASSLIDAARYVPMPDKQSLDTRRDDARAVKAAADKLHDRLIKIQQEAQERLRAAGVPASETAAASNRLAAGTGRKLSTCFEIGNAANAVAEEATLLAEALGRWNLKDGKVVTSDEQLRSRLMGPRMRIETAVRRRTQMTDPLRSQ